MLQITSLRRCRKNMMINLRRNPISVSVSVTRRCCVILWLLAMLQLVHMKNLSCLSISDFDIDKFLTSIIIVGCNLLCVGTNNHAKSPGAKEQT